MSRFIILLALFALTAQVRAGAGENAGDEFYIESPMFQSRPNPTSERYFGGIGTTGLKARIDPGVVLKVEEMSAGSPSRNPIGEPSLYTAMDKLKPEKREKLMRLLHDTYRASFVKRYKAVLTL